MTKKQRFWTIEEDIFLKENYGPLSAKELAVELNRSYDSIRHRLSGLGLKLSKQIYVVYKNQEVIARGTAEECAEQLGVTKRHVQALALDHMHERIACYNDSKNAIIAFKETRKTL